MAGIDKIYGNEQEWTELFCWLARYRPQYCKFLMLPFWTDWDAKPPVRTTSGAISMFPVYADKWLYKNCPLKWVKGRIKNQYNGDPSRKRK